MGRFESRKTLVENSQELGAFLRGDNGERFGFDPLGPRHGLIQNTPALGSQIEAIDPCICRMRTTDQVTTAGES